MIIHHDQRMCESPKFLYFLRDFTFKQLKNLIIKIFKFFQDKNNNDIRLWKLDSNISFKQFMIKYRSDLLEIQNSNNSSLIYFSGISLENYKQEIIADSGITDNDIIFVEYKKDRKWIFKERQENIELLKIPSYEDYSYEKYWENVFNQKINYWNSENREEYSNIIRKFSDKKVYDTNLNNLDNNNNEITAKNEIDSEFNNTNLCFTCNKKCVNIYSSCLYCNKVFYCSNSCYKSRKNIHYKNCLEYFDKSNKANVNGCEKSVKAEPFLATGIQNTGFMCFLNSSLQCLYYTEEFQKLIESQSVETYGTTSIVGSIIDLFNSMSRGTSYFVNPNIVRDAISEKNKQFSGNSQNDAQEFLSYLLEVLCESQFVLKKELSEIFAGEYHSIIKCTKCQNSSIKAEPFFSLNLPIDEMNKEVEIRVTTLSDHVIIYNLNFDQDIDSLKDVIDKIKDELLIKNIRLYYISSEKVISEIDINKQSHIFKSELTLIVLYALEIEDEIPLNLVLAVIGEDNNNFLINFRNWKEKTTKHKILIEQVKSFIVKYIGENSIKFEISSCQKLNSYSKVFLIVNKPANELWAQINRRKIDRVNSLNIPSNIHSDLESLNYFLAKFTSVEVLNGNNQIFCEICNEKTEATKCIRIKYLPQIFILQLKRFKFLTNLRRIKNSKLIKFPLEIQCSSNDQGDLKYELYSILNHQGSIDRGHYTAFCRSQKLGKWLEFDDAKVREISENEIVSDSAYVLFYRRKCNEDPHN